MASNNKYLEPMLPWPPLSQFSKKFNLPENKISIFAYSAGDKENPALIMIHGLGDEADTWRHNITPLSNKFHVIALDLPGFGRSDQPNTKYTPSFLMNSIVGLMDVCQIQSAILMGSSLGGILSHQIAIEHPDRVSRLVLIGGGLSNSASMGDWQIRLMALPLLGEWLYTRLRKDPDAAYDSIRNVYHDLDQMTELDREFLYERVNKRVWSDGQRRAYFSTLRELGSWIKRNQTASISLLKNLEIPTLAIRGAYDQIFSKNNLDDIAQNQPNVTVETIDNAGHLPHQEKPNRFLAVVSNWLEIFL
jgi:pimeloyl-ACP methyl ester carboxylesterase